MFRLPTLARRALILAAASVFAGAAAASDAFAQRAVTIVVPTTPGGTADILARLVAPKLSQRWGQPVVVENKPGAGSLIGAEYVARAPADGHTLMLAFNELVTLNAINRNARIDVVNDLTRIGRIGSLSVLVLASPKLPANTMQELIATLRENPGKYTYASNGAGSLLQLYSEMFKREAKVDVLHVPYRGALEASTALLGGQVDLLVQLASGNVQSYVTSGRAKAYAVTSPTRLPDLPQVPTAAEAGLPGLNLEAWYGLFGPAKMPAELVARINRDLNAVLEDPEVLQRLANVKMQAQPGPAAAFDAFFRAEGKRWTEVVQSAGIQSSQ